MAIRVTCPDCDKQIQVADTLAGRRVKCPKCTALIPVPSPDEDDIPVLEGIEEDEPRAPAKGPKKTAARNAVTTKKIVAPKKVASAPAKRRRDDDEDEDDDDRGSSSGKSNKGLVIAVSAIGGVLLIGGIVAAILVISNKNKPEKVVLLAPEPSKAPGPKIEKPPEDTKTVEGPKELEIPKGGFTPDQVYQHLLKSTVWIVNSERIRIGNQEGIAISSGSGVLLHRGEGLVLTNYHVVRDNPDAVVIFPSFRGKEVIREPKYYGENQASLGIRGRVVERDAGHDMALIKLERVPDQARALPLAPKSPDTGQNVHSIGGSGVDLGTGGGTLWRYTHGQVRSVYEKKWDYHGGQHVESYIVETDSATNPGDSGGPMVNDRVQLVAIVSGGDLRLQSVSMNIDVREIRKLVLKYFAAIGKKYEEPPSTTPTDQLVDVQSLMQKLAAGDSRERLKAILALQDMGAGAQIAVPSLVPVLAKDSDPVIRRAAGNALDAIGPPAKADLGVVLQALKSSNTEARQYAARTLASSGIGEVPPADAVPILGAALKDSDAAVRKNVALALGNLGPQARGVVTDLLDQLKDSDAEARKAAVVAVGKVGVEGKESVPLLIGLLKDRNVETRRAGAVLLAKLGPDGKEAAPALAAALKDPDREMRRAILEALGQFGPDAKAAVPGLREILQGKEKTLLQPALDVLTQIGPAAQDAIPELIQLLEDQSLRESVATALGKIGKPAVPPLREALKDNNARIRTGACMALGEIGPDAKDALFQLSSLQRDPDTSVRDAARDAMKKVQRKK
jgi:HEAT repeat protein/S1-C subfamily serine protease